MLHGVKPKRWANQYRGRAIVATLVTLQEFALKMAHLESGAPFQILAQVTIFLFFLSFFLFFSLFFSFFFFLFFSFSLFLFFSFSLFSFSLFLFFPFFLQIEIKLVVYCVGDALGGNATWSQTQALGQTISGACNSGYTGNPTRTCT